MSGVLNEVMARLKMLPKAVQGSHEKKKKRGENHFAI